MENFMYLKKKKKQEHIFHPTKDGSQFVFWA